MYGQVIEETSAGIQRVIAPFAFAVPQFQLQVPVRQRVALNIERDLFPTADIVGSTVFVVDIRAGQLYGSFGLLFAFAAFVDDKLHIIIVILKLTVFVFLIIGQIIIIIEITEFRFIFFPGVFVRHALVYIVFRIICFVFAVCLVYPGHEFIKFSIIGVVVVIRVVFVIYRIIIFAFKPVHPFDIVLLVFRRSHSAHPGIARDLGYVYLRYPNVYPYGNNVIFVLFELIFVVGLITAAGNGVFGVVNQQSCAVFRVSVRRQIRCQLAGCGVYGVKVIYRRSVEFGIQLII